MRTKENTAIENRAYRWAGSQKVAGKAVLMGILEDCSKETELVRAGIVPEELERLGREERKRILLAVGLNPGEYDF